MARIFFTGFPGFLGRELLPRVLRRRPDATATCLVQQRYLDLARKAVDAIAATEPALGERIELAVGDICAEDLDLGSEYAALASDTVEVFHLAAVYDLAVGRDVAMRVNVEGTKNILRFCKQIRQLERLQYVSTCYVSGRHAGIFREEDLVLGQSFNNFYEETKHLAEREVREAMSEVPTTIYRPAVVTGDSATGATQKYDGPYFIIRWLLKQPGPVALMPVVGDPEVVRLNLVPRDFVVDAIDYLSGQEVAVGKCYQLADPSPLTVAEILRALEEDIGKKLLRIPITIELAKTAIAHVPGVGKLLGFPSDAVDYFVHPTHYLTLNATTDLAAAGITVPPLRSYLPNMIEFVRHHPEIGSQAMV